MPACQQSEKRQMCFGKSCREINIPKIESNTNTSPSIFLLAEIRHYSQARCSVSQCSRVSSLTVMKCCFLDPADLLAQLSHEMPLFS